MTWSPDFQKDEIIARRKREMVEALREAEAMNPAETMRKQRFQDYPPANTLTGQFQTIMEAPDYMPTERAKRLLEWAHLNYRKINRALEQVPA